MNEASDIKRGASSTHYLVEEVLYSLHLPAEFDERCKQASRAAYCIDQVRRRLERHNFSPAPFGRVVRAAAVLAKVSLEPVYSSFGLSGLEDFRAANAKPFVRLAKLLMPAQQAKGLLGWAFRETVDPEAHQAAEVVFLGLQSPDPEEELAHWEAQCSDEIRAEWEEIRRIIDAEYDMG